MPKLFDLVKVNIATTGTGTVTFGSVFSPEFFTPSEVGAVDGDTVRYVLIDGTDIELGVGTIGGSVTTMTRTVTRSRVGGVAGTSKLNLSGSAHLALTAAAADIETKGNHAKHGVRGLTGSSSTSVLTVTADAVLFRNDTTGETIYASPGATYAIDTATAGPAALGRDKASAFTSGADVHFFLIYNPTTATISGLCSEDSLANYYGPAALPTGYTAWAYVTTVKLNASTTTLFGVVVRGSSVSYKANNQALTSGTATAETAVALSTWVPANALRVLLNTNGNNNTAGAGPYTFTLRHTSGSTYATMAIAVTSAGGNAQSSMCLEIPNVSRNVYYLTADAGTRFNIYVTGYIVPNGDS